MSKDPAVLFYTSDFLTGTELFTFEEKGKYIHLLCIQHQIGHLPEDYMLRIIGSKTSQIWSKFVQDELTLWFNIRMEEEKQKRSKYVESRVFIGKMGGRPSKQNHKVKHKVKHMPNLTENENEDRNKDLTKDLDSPNTINIIVNNSNKENHGKAIKYFCDKYVEKVGMKYVFNGGKDGELIKEILLVLTLDQFKEKCDRFFNTHTDFIKKAGYTIGVFKSQINKLGGKHETGIERFLKDE